MEREKLTKEALEGMRPGGRSKTFRCDSAAELEAARRNAYQIRANSRRDDGMTYAITTSYKAMTITVAVIEAENKPV